MVVFRSTTPWVAVSSRSSSNLLTVISMVVVATAGAASTGILGLPTVLLFFSYIKCKSNKTSSNRRRGGEVEIWSIYHWLRLFHRRACGCHSNLRTLLRISSSLTQFPQTLNNRGAGRLDGRVEKEVQTAIYAPSCSVSLLSNLLKSLSSLRTLSIFSTECRTVVWCLPPNCRPISGKDASVRCFARYIAIWRG